MSGQAWWCLSLIFNPRTQEVGADRSLRVQGQLDLQSEILSKKNNVYSMISIFLIQLKNLF